MTKIITLKLHDGSIVTSSEAPEGSSQMECVDGKVCFYTCTQEGSAIVSGEHEVRGPFLGDIIAMCSGMGGLIILQNRQKPLYLIGVESGVVRQMSGRRGAESFFKKAKFQSASSPCIDISYCGLSSVYVTIPGFNQVMVFNRGNDCTPVIGNGQRGFTTGGNAMGVMLDSPAGICKAAGVLLVSDRGNRILRTFSGNGADMMSTGVIGDPDIGKSVDGAFPSSGFEAPGKMRSLGDIAAVIDGNKLRIVNMRTMTVSTVYESAGRMLSVAMISKKEVCILEDSDAEESR